MGLNDVPIAEVFADVARVKNYCFTQLLTTRLWTTCGLSCRTNCTRRRSHQSRGCPHFTLRPGPDRTSEGTLTQTTAHPSFCARQGLICLPRTHALDCDVDPDRDCIARQSPSVSRTKSWRRVCRPGSNICASSSMPAISIVIAAAGGGCRGWAIAKARPTKPKVSVCSLIGPRLECGRRCKPYSGRQQRRGQAQQSYHLRCLFFTVK
jgi:hypothetical protein